jgi:DNA-3-methyladenine glycosylase II
MGHAIILIMRIICVPPYDFQLSWRLASSLSDRSISKGGAMAIWWEQRPTTLNLRQTADNPPTVEVIAEPIPRKTRLFQAHMRSILNADLELQPFYRRARRDRTLRPIINALIGLKPLRPPDLFQMIVIAVTEQQISLKAARNVRERLVEAYGQRTGRLTAFPRPRDIAALKVEDLRNHGLSQRKAEYVLELAEKMARGDLDTRSWDDMPDGDLIRLLLGQRGVGEWTAEYILARGLGRPDVVPASDLGVRRVVGLYMADGDDLSPEEAREILEPWSPWRGLLAFYLLAYYRMTHMGLDQAQ